MDFLLGFTLRETNVCTLKKALYGRRDCFGRLSHLMQAFGFKQTLADHILFYKRVGDDITMLLVYVSEMIVTGSNITEVENFCCHLMKELEMKDLGALKYVLILW